MKSKRSGRRSSNLRVYWIASFGAAIILGLMLWVLLSLDLLLSWLIAINGVAFLAYGYDKRIAGSGRVRVPEALLLALAYTGGSLGALLGMRLFRHKTSKMSFQARFWVIVALQVVLIAFYYVVILPSISS